MRSGGRCQDVAEREHPGVVDDHVDRQPFSLRVSEKLPGGLRACEVDLHAVNLGAEPASGMFPPLCCGFGLCRPGEYHRLRLFERAASGSRQHEVIPRCCEPQGEAAPDTRSSAGYQRPGASGNDLVSHCGVFFVGQGSFASSSRIFRGRSGQFLQHFMSTEYMRAMQ